MLAPNQVLPSDLLLGNRIPVCLATDPHRCVTVPELIINRKVIRVTLDLVVRKNFRTPFRYLFLRDFGCHAAAATQSTHVVGRHGSSLIAEPRILLLARVHNLELPQ